MPKGTWWCSLCSRSQTFVFNENMDYVRYLKAKQTVDDRALNEGVLSDLKRCVHDYANGFKTSHVIQVLEVGAGIGAMCARLFHRGVFPSCVKVEYTLVDVKADVLVAASESLVNLQRHTHTSCAISNIPEPSPAQRFPVVFGPNNIHKQNCQNDTLQALLMPISLSDNFVVSFHAGDAIDYAKANPQRFDLVVAAAVLDLWMLNDCLPHLFSALDNQRLNAFYFPINFDGVTDFFPPSGIGVQLDYNVEQAFHLTMGKRRIASYETLAAHTGRRMLPALMELGVRNVSVGSSAWIVYPRKGRYIGDESFFLQCIIDFIESSVDPGQDMDSVDPALFHAYITKRRRQIEDGSLYYIAHNIDTFGFAPSSAVT